MARCVMNANYTQKLPETMIEDAKRVDLVELAARYTTLRRETPTEHAGACPKCAGRDRFHVSGDGWFFCRQCHPERADAITFLQWMTPGLGFTDAVLMLANGSLPARPQAPVKAQKTPAQRWQDDAWQHTVKAIVTDAHERLCWHDAGAPGRDYLLRRGLTPATWRAYGLGYRTDAFIPGSEGKRRAPAILIPWQGQRGLYALRFRFLTPQDGHKMTSLRGSDFSSKLFGGQCLPHAYDPAPSIGQKRAESARTLVICEGEINAMSIYQVAATTALDVLSIGSQGGTLTTAALGFVGRYGQVILWLDEGKQARRLLSKVPGAFAVAPAQDANDMLQAGTLGAFLAAIRIEACNGDLDKLATLLHNLKDGDAGAVSMARQLETFSLPVIRMAQDDAK